MKCPLCANNLIEVQEKGSTFAECIHYPQSCAYKKRLHKAEPNRESAPISRPAQTEDIKSKAVKEPIPDPHSKAASDKVSTGLILIPFYSILKIGAIFIEGLRYGKDNWKKGVNDKEYQEERLEHAFLHLIKYKEGDRSEEHLAKVAWFCVTQLELERLEQCTTTPTSTN